MKVGFGSGDDSSSVCRASGQWARFQRCIAPTPERTLYGASQNYKKILNFRLDEGALKRASGCNQASPPKQPKPGGSSPKHGGNDFSMEGPGLCSPLTS